VCAFCWPEGDSRSWDSDETGKWPALLARRARRRYPRCCHRLTGHCVRGDASSWSYRLQSLSAAEEYAIFTSLRVRGRCYKVCRSYTRATARLDAGSPSAPPGFLTLATDRNRYPFAPQLSKMWRSSGRQIDFGGQREVYACGLTTIEMIILSCLYSGLVSR
jgi:hypothetical protein